MIERYGEKIELDLFEHGWDLLDYFRGARPWAQLMRIVNTLPSWSHTGRAMADDDELQRHRERREASHGKPREPRRLADWGAFDELIATIVDVGNLIQVAIARANAPKGKRYAFHPHKRPRSAADRAEARRDADTVAEIVDMLRPRG